MCDDGVFCNGVERCDTAFQAARWATTALAELDLACSTDACHEGAQTCDHDISSGCRQRAPASSLVTASNGLSSA